MTVPAHAIAQAVLDRLPDPDDGRLHQLLYMAQGHHLGWFGQPLFSEPIAATDHGPHVAMDTAEDGPEPGEAELNTVGFIVSRYGGLPTRDLAVLINAQSPYQLAEVARQADQNARIDVDVMRRHFAAAEAAERRDAGITGDALAAFLAGARERLADPLRMDTPDDLDRLRARVADHAR